MNKWLAHELHISWHIAVVSAGLLAGAALAIVMPYAVFAGWEWLLTALALLMPAVGKRARWALVLALSAGVCGGLWLGAQSQQELAQYSPYYGQDATLQGKITEDTTFGPEGEQRMRLGSVQVNGQPFGGHVWVSSSTQAWLKRGDVVALEGKLSEGFGNLYASMFYARLADAKRPEPGDVARRVRDWFANAIRTAIAEPQASLGIGYLVGQRTALPDTLEDEFRMLGLVHLVVASGSNLIIIARLLRKYLARISKFTATAATLTFIGGFLLITGFSTSMSRAALVAGLSLLAWYYGRAIHPVVLLLFAAAGTVAVDPSVLWGDLGWYLSFAAFGGVLLLAPLINRYFWGDREPGFIRYIFVATLSAQIATFPIIALTFGEYSPLAIVSNLLIQPLVPFAMGLTFLAGLAGVLVPGLAAIAGWPAQALLSYMTNVTGWLSKSTLAHGEVAIGPTVLISFYVLLAVIFIFLKRRTGHNFRRDSLME